MKNLFATLNILQSIRNRAIFRGASEVSAGKIQMQMRDMALASTAVILCLAANNQAKAVTCQDLVSLDLAHAKVTAATWVPAGTFTPPILPGAVTPPTPIPNLPAFCRVQITSSPSSDSSIGIEVWLPEHWNGKYLQTGNDGFAGMVPYIQVATAIQRGYAAAGTDDGHQDPVTSDASWALGHPQKVIDYGYRALKETTDKAKAVITAYTGNGPHYSYFAGCSDGGREALMESQRYPDDFNGIVAGDASNNAIPLLSQFIWNAQALLASAASYIPPAKLPAITNAAQAACDAADGVKDGVISKPRQCRFNPDQLLCKGEDSDSCLTAPQVTALKKIYSGPRDSAGQRINPGFLPGAEADANGWSFWITGPGPDADSITQAAQYQYGTNSFKYFVFADPNWDLHTFNIDTDVNKALATPIAGQTLANVVESVDPDLSVFRAHGGKLIQYHGTTDAAIPLGAATEYYDSVKSFFGIYDRDNTTNAVGNFYRLFVVPGMQHCYAGPGANSFGQISTPPLADPAHDVIKALEAWVEQGQAPNQIIATKYTNDDPTQPALFSRPLCPYPAIARWNGTGDVTDAANWSCR